MRARWIESHGGSRGLLVRSALLGLVALLAGSVHVGAQTQKFPPLAPLPPVPVPADNPMSPAKVELGKLLFFDGRLSGNGLMGCVSCHIPQVGWGLPSPISRGYPGTQHWRRSQTILNSAYYAKIFWDGSVNSLEAQAPAAAEGAVAGNGDGAMMEMRLRFVPEYVRRFKEVFGTEQPRITHAWMAIAAFERTIVSDASLVPFDRFIGGDANALSPEAKRGYALFTGKAGCIQCHNGPLASDQKFHALGVPENPVFFKEPLYQITHRWEQYQKGISEQTYRNAGMDMGLYYVTKNPKDIGKFRTPSLREAVYVAPYMHNGVLATLEEVVAFYNAGGGRGANKSPLLKPLGLSKEEQADLVAFIKSLSMEKPLIVLPPALPQYATPK